MIRFCLDITGTEFRLLDSHYEEFRNVYDERFSKRYGFWRPVTDEVVGKLNNAAILISALPGSGAKSAVLNTLDPSHSSAMASVHPVRIGSH